MLVFGLNIFGINDSPGIAVLDGLIYLFRGYFLKPLAAVFRF